MHKNRVYGISKPHPRPDYAGKIELYKYRRGPNSPGWDARFKIGGQWTGWVALGTTEWDDAIFVSVDKLRLHENAAANGVHLGRPKAEVNTVREIAEKITLPRLEAERDHLLATMAEKKGHSPTIKINRIKNTLVPAFGDRGIAHITVDDLDRFVQAYTVDGTDKPKRSTIANINSAWLEILRDAFEAKYIDGTRKKALVISQSGFKKGKRGASFSPEEMQKLRAFMTDKWIMSGHTRIVRENRYLMRALVSLMSCTGLTPGLEVETLAPWQVIEMADSHGHISLRVSVMERQGKREPDRVVWARVNDVWPVVDDFRRLKAWIKANATDEYHRVNPRGYLFARPSDGEFPNFSVIFAEIMGDLEMRTDPTTGVWRRQYSCRHYYATQSILDGVGIADVAKNMGTSIRMIDEHYAHVIADLRSGVLTGSQKMAKTSWLQSTPEERQREKDRFENDPHYNLDPEDLGWEPIEPLPHPTDRLSKTNDDQPDIPFAPMEWSTGW